MSLAGSRRFSRRGALLLAGSGLASWGRLYATGGEFWDKKPPSQWDAEQIDRLLHKSPWAKDVTAELIPGESDRDSGPPGAGGGYPGGGGGNPRGGVGYPGGGGGMGGPRIGIGIPGIGGIPMPRRGGGGRRGGGSYEKGTVRWESAQPVIDAQKTPLPEAFANHYVISVSGIPLRNRDSRDDSIDDLKRFAILEPKGRDVVEARLVQRHSNAYASLLFGFSKEALPLTTADREVQFSVRLGSLMVRAKFDPREMQYHKQLAL